MTKLYIESINQDSDEEFTTREKAEIIKLRWDYGNDDKVVNEILEKRIGDYELPRVIEHSNGYGDIHEKLTNFCYFRRVKQQENELIYYAKVYQEGEDYRDAGIKITKDDNNKLILEFSGFKEDEYYSMFEYINELYTPELFIEEENITSIDDLFEQIKGLGMNIDKKFTNTHQGITNLTNVLCNVGEHVVETKIIAKDTNERFINFENYSNNLLNSIKELVESEDKRKELLENILESVNKVNSNYMANNNCIMYLLYNKDDSFFDGETLYVKENKLFNINLMVYTINDLIINKVKTGNFNPLNACSDYFHSYTINEDVVEFGGKVLAGSNQPVMNIMLEAPLKEETMYVIVDGGFIEGEELRPFSGIKCTVKVKPTRILKPRKFMDKTQNVFSPLSKFPWGIIKPLISL